MKIFISDNLAARKLQIRLRNTEEYSPNYSILLERYSKVLSELPPEGKLNGKDGFLVPWKAK
jgi:hypothetical protein